MAQGDPSLPKNLRAKTMYSTNFRFCHDKSETISIYGKRKDLLGFFFMYVLMIFQKKEELSVLYNIIHAQFFDHTDTEVSKQRLYVFEREDI